MEENPKKEAPNRMLNKPRIMCCNKEFATPEEYNYHRRKCH